MDSAFFVGIRLELGVLANVCKQIAWGPMIQSGNREQIDLVVVFILGLVS